MKSLHPTGYEWRDYPAGALFDGCAMTLIQVSRLACYDDPGDTLLAPLTERKGYDEWRHVVTCRGHYHADGFVYGLPIEFRRGAWDLVNPTAPPGRTLRTHLASELYRELIMQIEYPDVPSAPNVQRIAQLVDWQAAL